MTAVYEESEKYKLVETFGPESFTVLEDGRLLMKSHYKNMDTAVKEILSFAEKAEVIGPEEVRTELLYRINAIKRNIKHDIPVLRL